MRRSLRRKPRHPIVEALIEFLKAIMAMLAFINKEVVEIWRRPGALISLILGPFVIMALFGAGYSGQRKPLDTVIVVPAGANLPTELAYYEELTGPNVNVIETTQDPDGARERLRRQQIQLLIVAPENAEERFRAGEQSVIGVEYNSVNPVDNMFTQIVAEQEVSSLNQALVEQMAAAGQAYMVQATGSQEMTEVPPDVVARPTRAELQNVAPSQPTVTEFYAPAVLALVLQHMGVTLASLSIVRERLSGAMDLFRVAPIGTLGILIGKYLAFGFVNALIATAITLLVVVALGVPMLGSILEFVQIVALLTFASLGLGLFISAVADSERQAVQLSMLVLLASVFMSGFVLPLEEFDPPIQWAGYLLPVTHGIRLLQDIMLRGGTFAVWQFWALAGFGLAMFVLAAISLRRNLAGT